MEKFYTSNQLANLLNVHPRTINRMIWKGRIRAVNMGSDKKPNWRIYDGELQRFMQENYEKYGEFTQIDN